MAHQEKSLPALPSRRDGSIRPLAKAYSQETYTQLLEQENQQLRLLNQELQALRAKEDLAVETERRVKLQERARYEEEIRRRDKFIEEISNTVLDVLEEIRRYKDANREMPDTEEISVYSQFEFDSPI